MFVSRSISATKFVSSLTTNGCSGLPNEVRFLEHVQARVTLKANRRGSIALFLTSPQGTKSQLLHFRSGDTSSEGFGGWPFMTTHCWEENPKGEWKLEVQISGHYTHATLVKWDLVLHGTKDPPQPHSVQCDIECEGGCRGPDATQCMSCKHFGLRGDDGKMKCVLGCPDGLYGDNDSRQCLVCHPSCFTCHGPVDSDCLTCMTNKTVSAGQCIEGCPPGSFQSANGQQLICNSCDAACAECVGPTASHCVRCSSGLMLDGSKCTSQCPDGTFAEMSDRQCVSCDKDCLTCDGAGDTDCTSCEKAMLLVEDAGQCVTDCSDGYYQAATVSGGLLCQQCDSLCALCSDRGPDRCLACHQGLYLFHNACVAVCPLSTFGDDQALLCHSCHSSCQTCFGPSEGDCLTCSSPFYLTAGKCVKSCVHGSYPSQEERTCKPCHHTCSQCHGPGGQDCNSCTDLYLLNGACVTDCPESYYGNNLLHACGKCDGVCRTCNGPSKYNCTDCNSPFVLQSSTCSLNCPDGSYKMSDVCVSCHERCASCEGPAESNCLSCSQLDGQPLYLESGHCVISCLSGHYKDNNNSQLCLQCADGCSKCLGPSQKECSECKDGFYLDGYECVKSCPVNGFADTLNRKCIPCSEGCATCDQTVSHCTTCRPGFYLSGGSCVHDCPVGTFADDSGNCSLCASSCAACSHYASHCTRCKSLFLLDELSCDHSCPDGKYPDRQLGKCLPCSHECSACTGRSSSHCLQCSDGYLLHITSCVSSCPNHTFADGKTASCVDCHPSCVACGGRHESNCTVCSEDLTLAAGRCVASRTCPDGQYFRVSSGKCEPCDFSCKTCDGEGRGSCLTCPSGLYLDMATTSCNANCPDYFYGDSSSWVCAQCHSTCKACSGPGGNECLSCDTSLTLDDDGTCRLNCEDGYYLDSEANICTRCDPACMLCIHRSDHCLACKPPYALLNKSCVSLCPVGMRHDETRHVCEACGMNCLECDSSHECRECMVGMFLLHGECVSPCPLQYVGNMTTGQCVACPHHCRQCSEKMGEVVCTECDNGYHKLGVIGCVETCPAGYFLDFNSNECHQCHMSCARCAGADAEDCLSCADSTILFGSRCVMECPPRTFHDSPSNQCLPCDVRCTHCFGTDYDSCTECTHNFFFVSTNSSCVSSCPLAFYPDRSSAECRPCHSSCSTCEGAGAASCLSCVTGLVAYTGECLKMCPRQTYEEKLESQHVCRACHGSCAACSGPGFNQCSQCPHGSVLSEGKCRSSCSVGFYLDTESQSCYPCHKSCQTCAGSSPTSCLSCSDSVLFVDGGCKGKCPPGYFQEQLTCHKCDDSCIECSGRGPLSCTKCPTGKKLVEGHCLVVCSEDEYRHGNSCLGCHSSCATCSDGSPGGCLSCQAPKLHHHVRMECLPCCLEKQIRSKSTSCCDCYLSLSKCILASEIPGNPGVQTTEATSDEINTIAVQRTAENFKEVAFTDKGVGHSGPLDKMDSSDWFMVVMGVMIGLIAFGFVIFLIVAAVRRKSNGFSLSSRPRYYKLAKAEAEADADADVGTAFDTETVDIDLDMGTV